MAKNGSTQFMFNEKQDNKSDLFFFFWWIKVSSRGDGQFHRLADTCSNHSQLFQDQIKPRLSTLDML